MPQFISRSTRHRNLAWLAALLAVACSDGTLSDPFGPGKEPAADLRIVPVSPAAAPPESLSVSFYARRDRRSEGRIRLADQPGAGRGHEYLRLTIPKNASESKSALIAASFSASTPWGYAL